MSVDEYIAQLLDRAPVATAEQLAKVAVILRPVEQSTRPAEAVAA